MFAANRAGPTRFCTPRTGRAGLFNSPPVRGGFNIGFPEVVALVQQRGAAIARNSVGKAVAEVELRRMAGSFAIAGECGKRSPRIVAGNRNAFDPCDREEFQYV